MQRKWQVLIVVCVGIFVSSLDLFIVNIAFPDIRADFGGTSLRTLSWVLNVYAIVLAALLVPGGRWADALGRKRAFLGGLALFTASSAACAAAPDVGVLIAARAVQASGAALMLPTSLGLLLPEFPPQERHQAVGFWAAASGIAAASGPPIGGLLVEASWRWIFLVNVPIGVGALIAGARILREVRDPATTRPDVLGAAMATGGIGALVIAIVQGQDWGWGSVRVVGLFVAAILLVGAVARRSAHHPAPLIEPELVRVRAFRVACAAILVFFAGFAAMLLGGVLFLTGPWHESVLTAGLMLAPGPAMAAIWSVPGARLSGRFGPQHVGMLGGLVFAAAGVWYLSFLGDDVHYATGFLPAGLLTGIGVGLTNPSLTAAATAALPPQRFATGVALLTMARQVGSAIGVALLVAVLGTPVLAADFHGAWPLVIGGGAGATLVLTLLGPVGAARDEPVAAAAPQAVPA